VRLLILLAVAVLSGCDPAPPPQKKADPVTEAWYRPTVEQLAAMNREAEALLQSGKKEQAAEIITKGQPLANRLLSAPRPTLAASEAASDLDHLYARMLLSNGHYGWARLQFQKNLARWKNWQPQTPETARRVKLAREGIAECDRRIVQ
jgi:hypothetical protein